MSGSNEVAPTQNAEEAPTQTQAGPKPPWGSPDEFNAEKAWSLLQNVRSDLSEAKSNLDAVRKEANELKEFRIKAQEAEEAAQETALSLHRERAARQHGLDEEQFEFLAELTDPDAIAARAEKLASMAAKTTRPVDPAQGSTSSGGKTATTADQFASAIEGAFTR